MRKKCRTKIVWLLQFLWLDLCLFCIVFVRAHRCFQSDASATCSKSARDNTHMTRFRWNAVSRSNDMSTQIMCSFYLLYANEYIRLLCHPCLSDCTASMRVPHFSGLNIIALHYWHNSNDSPVEQNLHFIGHIFSNISIKLSVIE